MEVLSAQAIMYSKDLSTALHVIGEQLFHCHVAQIFNTWQVVI